MMRLMIALLWIGLMGSAMADDEDKPDQGVSSLVSPEEASRNKAEAAAAASGVPATSRSAAPSAPSAKTAPIAEPPPKKADEAHAPPAAETRTAPADDMRAVQSNETRAPQTGVSASKSSIPLNQRKGGDITQCLEQGSNQAIAACAEKYRP